MKTLETLLFCLSALSLSGMALAHGTTTPQHGGVVQMNGETLFELVKNPAGVSLYVLDDDEPVNAAAMTAKLDVTEDGRRTDVTMVPATGNRFEAKRLKLAKGAIVGVLLIDNASKARNGTTFVVN